MAYSLLTEGKSANARSLIAELVSNTYIQLVNLQWYNEATVAEWHNNVDWDEWIFDPLWDC